MKILCFTTSHRRPYFIYNIINNILGQTYSDISYCVNIALDKLDQKDKYQSLLSDFQSDDRLKIVYNLNQHQQINYANAIKGFGHTDYDLFFKIDDDDIYRKNYIEKSIEYIKNNTTDILSYISNKHINNGILKNQIKSIGVWEQDTKSNIKFGMPSTFIFNKKACDLIKNISIAESKKIHRFEDGAWKQTWRKHNLVSTVVTDQDVFIYNIHKFNTSATFLLDEELTMIKNEHVDIVKFNHPNWKSYVYINKRNNRLYNINNDDHGEYTIKINKIYVTWDHWGKELYEKEYITDKIYYYKFVNKL